MKSKSLFQPALLGGFFLLVSGRTAFAQPLSAMSQTVYSVSTKESNIRYLLKSPLHDVHGHSEDVDGTALIAKDGKGSVSIRVPVESFESGNHSRDSRMQEVTEANRFPWVELKATCHQVQPPEGFPSVIVRSCKARLKFHGLEQDLEVPVTITYETGNRIYVKSNFSISLESFQVERPKIAFMKVDDTLQIEANLFFNKS